MRSMRALVHAEVWRKGSGEGADAVGVARDIDGTQVLADRRCGIAGDGTGGGGLRTG